MRMTKAEFVARVMADKAAEAERKRRVKWRGRWEAAIVKGEHIEQMRRRKRWKHKIKADTYYMLKNGEFAEVKQWTYMIVCSR